MAAATIPIEVSIGFGGAIHVLATVDLPLHVQPEGEQPDPRVVALGIRVDPTALADALRRVADSIDDAHTVPERP